MKELWIAIGLGNPGEEYIRTRHNAGFRVIDRLAERNGEKLKKAFLRPFLYTPGSRNEKNLILVKPLTYMNRSGNILPAVIGKWKAESRRVIIICDNMDLPPGEVRIKQKGSSAGHNGIKSVLEYLDSGDFYRIFVGVGRPSPGVSVVDHVLGYDEHEEHKLAEGEEKAAEAVMAMVEHPLSRVMNEFNRKQA